MTYFVRSLKRENKQNIVFLGKFLSFYSLTDILRCCQKKKKKNKTKKKTKQNIFIVIFF